MVNFYVSVVSDGADPSCDGCVPAGRLRVNVEQGYEMSTDVEDSNGGVQKSRFVGDQFCPPASRQQDSGGLY